MPDLWPFQPESDIRETLRWTTDIRTTPEGEMRDSLMAVQQSFALRFILDAEELTVARGLIEANPYGNWYLPLWTDVSRGGTILSADTVISCDTDGAYVAGGHVVIWQDRSTYVVAEIDTIGSGTLTLTAAVGADFTNPSIVPIRTAIAPLGVEYQRIYHDFVQASMTFIVRDATETETSPFATYSSLPVMTDLLLAGQGVPGSIRQEVSVMSDGFGWVAVETLRDVIDATYAINWQDETIADVNRRRLWFNYLRGRDGTFWLPSRSREMVAQAAITAAGTTITVRPVLPLPADYIGLHISIDGTIYREVTNAAMSGGNHVLTIAATGVDLTDPEICFLRRYRLDADEVGIDHIGNHRAIGSAPIREVAA